MKIKHLSETTAGAVASIAMPVGKTHKRTEEAANPAQQAAIAISMKKAGKKPKKDMSEDSEQPNPDAKKNVKSAEEIIRALRPDLPPDWKYTPPADSEPKPKPDKKQLRKDIKDIGKEIYKESISEGQVGNIMRGMLEAHISEEELLLAPGQGIKFKKELMPKRTDHEVEMARNQLRVAAQSAKRIYQNIKDLSEIQGLDGWVQAKITKASDYLDAVNNYIEGKKQMLEIQDEVDEQVDDLDQRISAQYNTPQALAKTKTLDQLAASGTQADYDKFGVMSPQQIERDYQNMLAAEPAQDAAVYANPKLTPSARRPVQRYNPKGVPIRETDIEEAHKLSAHEKFKRGLKRAGYDPDAGADRLLNLIARQAEERKDFERKQKEQDAEFYGKLKGVKEDSLNEFAPNGGDDNYDRKIYFAVQEPDEHYSTYALNPNTIDTDELKARFGKKLWAKGPFMDLDDAHEAIWAHIEKNKGMAEGGFDIPEIPRAPQPKPDPKNKTVDEDWQKTNRRDKTSGMSRKAVKQYRRENPGSKLQTAVTTKPSKLKKGSKSAKRRKSFCSRMRGMKKSRTSAKTARDPNSNINKALRRWNCESVEEMRNLVMLAEQKIAMLKEEQGLEENLHKWFKEKWVRFGPDGKIRGDCARGDDSEGKPKCLPQSKAHSLGKKGRASAAARKRREDPNPERSGKAINVATKKKSNEGVSEGGDDRKETVRMPPEMTGRDPSKPYVDVPGTSYTVSVRGDDATTQQDARHLGTVLSSVPNPLTKAAGIAMRYAGQYDKLPTGEKVARAMDSAGNPDYISRHLQNKKTVKEQVVVEEHEMCPECGGAMYSEEMINEKKDACYYKVKSRYKVWPSAYASGALVKCRNKGAKNWGNKSK